MTGFRVRSISLPIILGSLSIVLTITMLVGWILVMVQNGQLTRRVTENTLLMVAGIVSFAAIMSVIVLFSVFLVREILEVRRQIRFIDSVTHELKSPLASLSLCVQTLERPELPEPKAAELRGMMRQDISRLNVFIEDILEASRIDDGRSGVAVSEFTLREIVDFAVRAAAIRYSVDQAAFDVTVDPELELRTDRTSLETVVKNLVDNAVKYSGPEVRVKISSTLDDRFLHLEIRDAGIGIPAQALKRVVERFYRVPDEAVRRRPGTGLGLYVVRAMVRSLGGRIAVDSPGEGQGTTVSVRLPRARVLATGTG